MEAQLPANYEAALKAAESKFFASTEGTIVSDPRVQIYVTPKGGISIKVYGQKSKWLYWALLRFLKNRAGLQKFWKDRVGTISYTPKKAEE